MESSWGCTNASLIVSGSVKGTAPRQVPNYATLESHHSSKMLLVLLRLKKKCTQSQSKHRKKFHYDCFLTGFFWLRLPISSCCYTSSADYQSLWYLRFPKKPQQEKSAKSAWNFLRSRCFCKLTVYCCFSGTLVTVT